MDFSAVERQPGAFQRPVSPAQVDALLARTLGEGVPVARVVEIATGTYNNTYRVELADREPVVLRVAPAPSLQHRGDYQAMRNEHAATPLLAVLGPLVPRTLAVDFTHEVLGRDALVQQLLPGISASAVVPDWPSTRRASFFRALGAITRTAHSVRGEEFGRVAGPTWPTWSAATVVHLLDLAADLDDLGGDGTEIRRVADAAERYADDLDELSVPRLLHGDLWLLNVLVADNADDAITGVLDHDSAAWGDPAGDWTLQKIREGAGTERDAFWETYGPPPDSSPARTLFARAATLAATRLDVQRRGILEQIPRHHWDLAPVLAQLR